MVTWCHGSTEYKEDTWCIAYDRDSCIQCFLYSKRRLYDTNCISPSQLHQRTQPLPFPHPTLLTPPAIVSLSCISAQSNLSPRSCSSFSTCRPLLRQKVHSPCPTPSKKKKKKKRSSANGPLGSRRMVSEGTHPTLSFCMCYIKTPPYAPRPIVQYPRRCQRAFRPPCPRDLFCHPLCAIYKLILSSMPSNLISASAVTVHSPMSPSLYRASWLAGSQHVFDNSVCTHVSI